MHFFCCTASIVALMVCFGVGLSDIVVAPSSTEVQLGGSTYFNCSTSVTSKEVHWFHYPVSSTERTFVYGFGEFYNPYFGRFAMDKNVTSGEYNLILTYVVAGDAGKYECQDDSGGGMKKSAHLIILETDLMCQSNVNVQKVIGPNSCDIEPDQLSLNCTAQYHGNEAPILQWELNDNNKSITNGVAHQINGNRVIYTLTMANTEISEGSFYACRTTRSTSKMSCKSGNVTVVGSMLSTTDEACPSTTPYVVAILVICLLLIPIIIASSVVGGIYLDNRSKIVDRLVKRKDKVSLPVKEDPTTEEDVAQKADVTKDVERAVLLKKNAKTQEEQTQQNELLKKRILDLEKSSDEDKRKFVELKKKITHLEEEKRKFKEEKGKWKEEKRGLEERLYPSAIASYIDKPKLVSVIDIKGLKADSKTETRPIFGMTILHDKLFVVTEKSSEIEVYDSITFNPEPTWQIADMSNPLDVASCRTMNCLYVFNGEPNNEILQVDSNKTLLKQWSVEEDLGHLSVSREGNVVVSLFNGNKINEYSPDGKLIRTIRLSPADNISHPWHAIKTTSMHFLFSHGIDDDPLHRVCVVNADEKIVKSFGGRKGKEAQQMNRPVHLLEDSSRNVLVTDMKNGRVLLLSPTLEYKRILLPAADVTLASKLKGIAADSIKLRFPIRLCMDEERRILFVADNNYNEKVSTYESGRILIINCKT